MLTKILKFVFLSFVLTSRTLGKFLTLEQWNAFCLCFKSLYYGFHEAAPKDSHFESDLSLHREYTTILLDKVISYPMHWGQWKKDLRFHYQINDIKHLISSSTGKRYQSSQMVLQFNSLLQLSIWLVYQVVCNYNCFRTQLIWFSHTQCSSEIVASLIKI